ncbi:MAG: hypothetical protein DMG10_07435 [Acidobacteria bacterium]|nr:MAG: hypothetical protein DMG10_07435 [Acidobacteriota bacterium]
MNTEQQSRNQKNLTTKTRRRDEILWQKTKDFRAFSWERTHLACSGNNRETVSTLEACAPK